MQDGRITIDGLHIRYIEDGSGPALLLLHGGTLGFSCDMWRRNIPAFAAQGYRVLAFDQPGYGLSDSPPEYSLQFRQDFIARFLDATGTRRAALVGHSQAGVLAVGFALAHPERVTGAIIVGTGSLLPPLSDKQTIGSRLADQEPDLEQTRALLQANLYHRELITPEVLETAHRMSIGKNYTDAAKRIVAESNTARTTTRPLWQHLGEVTVPLMFIYGANDRGSTNERVPLARQLYPGLSFHLLTECHHIVQWDRADEFLRLTSDFLKGVAYKDKTRASPSLSSPA